MFANAILYPSNHPIGIAYRISGWQKRLWWWRNPPSWIWGRKMWRNLLRSGEATQAMWRRRAGTSAYPPLSRRVGERIPLLPAWIGPLARCLNWNSNRKIHSLWCFPPHLRWWRRCWARIRVCAFSLLHSVDNIRGHPPQWFVRWWVSSCCCLWRIPVRRRYRCFPRNGWKTNSSLRRSHASRSASSRKTSRSGPPIKWQESERKRKSMFSFVLNAQSINKKRFEPAKGKTSNRDFTSVISRRYFSHRCIVWHEARRAVSP